MVSFGLIEDFLNETTKNILKVQILDKKQIKSVFIRVKKFKFVSLNVITNVKQELR